MRDGQLVSVVYTGLKDRDALGHVFFHNLTTNLRWTEPKGLPSEITHYGQGALTRRYVKVIGFLILIAFGGNLLRNARIIDFSRDFLTTIAIFAFLLIPIGFFHLLFLIEKNKRGALKQLNAAIEADPTFVESLVA
ncbi:hypothetical protein AD946_01040 [Gluconobacter thailandicus]|nr:hypothetical protein AD946_01040 [Gluconobacter thailandicus]